MAEHDTDNAALTHATDLTVAWLANPNTRVAADDVPAFLASMHQAVVGLGSPPPASEPTMSAHPPAVTVRKSLASREHIISMIDGKPYKTLKRHLGRHGLTPAEYRARYNLKADYPMVAAAFREARQAIAKIIGLGNKGRRKKSAGAAAPSPTKTSAAAAKTAAKAHLGTTE